MLYKEFEKNREDILENEFCMQSNASTLPITDCPSYTPICTIGICIQGNAKIRMDSQEYTIHPHDVFVFMPGLLVSVIETSPHFTTNYFTLSNTFFYDVIKTIRSFLLNFLLHEISFPLSLAGTRDAVFHELLYVTEESDQTSQKFFQRSNYSSVKNYIPRFI